MKIKCERIDCDIEPKHLLIRNRSFDRIEKDQRLSFCCGKREGNTNVQSEMRTFAYSHEEKNSMTRQEKKKKKFESARWVLI